MRFLTRVLLTLTLLGTSAWMWAMRGPVDQLVGTHDWPWKPNIHYGWGGEK